MRPAAPRGRPRGSVAVIARSTVPMQAAGNTGRRAMGPRQLQMFAVIVALTLLGGGAVAAAAERAAPQPIDGARPDATLELSEGRLATGLDYMWGRGQLRFHAGHHAFHISGAPVADVGSPTLSAIGKVYHLTQLSDFSGTYSALNPVTAADRGDAAVPMRNEHGVLLILHVAAATPPGIRTPGSVRIQLNE